MKITTLFLSLLFIGLSATAEVSTLERNALVDLYTSTHGASWKTSWNLEQPVSSWYGVTVKDDKVVALRLSMNNLNGVLPESIGDLTHLESLELFFNNLQGQLPESIGKLKNLKSLVLNGNRIQGELPQSLYELSSLENLQLTSNDLSGPLAPQIQNLINLRVLHLFDNNFSGSIPKELGKIRALRDLMLGDNNFSGQLPQSVAFLEHLQNARFSGNPDLKTTGLPLEVSNTELQEQLQKQTSGVALGGN
ncbi:leucine-rich repeat domain-containing protein [Croceiramulus getboli]|nr:Two component regulator three Y domain protein [Flavobacteriaceae bacterium YJPT1-3]